MCIVETVKVNKNDWIGKSALIKLFKEEKEKEDIKIEKETTIADMMMELKKSGEQYHKENKLFYADVSKKISEIKSTLNVTVSEQEKQRIANMTMSELFCEMKKNIDCMKEKIDRIAGEQFECFRNCNKLDK